MKKNNGISKKKRAIGLLVVLPLLVGYEKINAQSTMLNVKDSIGMVINIDILKHEILIAGDRYKLKKYRLETNPEERPEELLRDALTKYQNLFAGIQTDKQQYYFTNDFYDVIIPVVQYFNSAYYVSLLMEHQDRFHPKVAVPDPKHHHDGTHQEVNDHKHLPK
ncbi:MAG: hypothetical protein WC756_13340 [Taibaiella sp.]|jgi:hypothetical protein